MWSVADVFDLDVFFRAESTIASGNWCGDPRRLPGHFHFPTYR